MHQKTKNATFHISFFGFANRSHDVSASFLIKN